mgnify:CR=1 FL=1
MERRNILALTLSIALAGFLAFGWEWYITPHDVTEDQTSPARVFIDYLLFFAPKLLPPIVLGLLARSRVVFYATLLAILAVGIDEYFAKFHMIYPQIAAKIVGYAIEIASPFVDLVHCSTIADPWMKLLSDLPNLGIEMKSAVSNLPFTKEMELNEIDSVGRLIKKYGFIK